MNILDKIQATFTHTSKLEEKENVYVKVRTVDANEGATFNDRAQGLQEFKEKRLKQLKNK